MLSTALLELRARRSGLHLLAALGALAVCWSVSSIPLPSLQQDSLLGEPQHLAYGYLYLPVILAPILASVLCDPFADSVPRGGRRSALVALACTVLGLLLTVAAAVAAALPTGDSEALRIALENAIWVVALVVALRGLLGWQWAALAVVAYGALGLFLPELGIFVIDRSPQTSDLVLGTLVVLAELGLLLSPRWSRLLV